MENTSKETYQDIYNLYQDAKADFAPREEAILRRYEQVTGDILESEDREALRDQKRAFTEYNLLEPVRNAFFGTERLSRVNYRIVPEASRETLAYYLTSAAYHFKNKTFYDNNKSIQAMHAFIGGVAFAHNYWDFYKQKWVFVPLDSLRIRWDKFTTQIDFSDCNWLQDTQWATAEKILSLIDDEEIYKEAEYAFKQYEPYVDRHKIYRKLTNSQWSRSSDRLLVRDDFMDMAEGRYRVIDHHERRTVTKRYFKNIETGEIMDASGFNIPQTKKFIREYGNTWEFKAEPEDEFWQVMIVPAINMLIKESPYPYKAKFFSFVPQVAYNVKPYVIQAQGVLDSYAKIAEGYNKRKAIELEHAINTVGGDWIAEEGAVLGHEEDWNTGERRRLRIFNNGYERPKRDESSQVPSSLYTFSNNDLTLLNELGIPKGYRGIKESANETGVLADTRIKQAEMTLQHIIDNAATSQYLDMLCLVKQIQSFVTDEQKIKLLDEEKYITLNEETINGVENQLDDSWDCTLELDTARPSATARQYAYNYMVGLLQYIPLDMMPVHEIYDAMEIPQRKKFVEWAKARYKAMGIDPDNLEGSLQAMAGMAQQQPPITQAGAMNNG